MTRPDSIDLTLALPGLVELEPVVRDLATRVVTLADLPEPQATNIRDAFLSALQLLESTLAEAGDDVVDLEIGASILPDRLEFRILEKGTPLGGPLLSSPGHDIARRIRPATAFDHSWWVQRGQEGSELHLAVDRPDARIRVLEEAQARLDAAHDESDPDVHASGESDQYRIRGFEPEDGLEVARRIYEAYGRTYPNPDLYVPDRIRRLNSEGRLHSIICESPDGEICGHYALERPDLGPTGEAGQAVLDHRHRGHGLMRPMRSAVEEAGRALGLLGIWSQPTAMHPLSQRMNLHFGSVPSALMAGLLPAGTTLRGGVAGEATDHETGGRRSCFLYWHPLAEEPVLSASAPDALVPLLTDLYAAREREVRFNATTGPARDGDTDPHCQVAPGLGSAWISVSAIGSGTIDSIKASAAALEQAGGAEAVFVDLPLDDPGTAAVAETLLQGGFAFGGIVPRSIARDGDLRAEDALRLHRHALPVDLPGLVAEGPLGQRLVETAFPSGA